MTIESYFPVQFLAVRKARRPATAAGVYLRWFVQPYLGLPGISPLDPAGRHGAELEGSGFRIFRHRRRGTIPRPQQVKIIDIVRDEYHDSVSDLVTRKGWKVLMPRDGGDTSIVINLHEKYRHEICYLRLDYSLCRGQSLHLRYTIHNNANQTDAQKRVSLHYDELAKSLGRGEYEKLSYALHVDNADESITEIRLVSNRPIVLGGLYIALRGHLPFYRWSPPNGDMVWEEVTPDMLLIRALDDVPIRPGKPSLLVDSMELFYDRYHDVGPLARNGDLQISFLFPNLQGVNLDCPLVREYFADQYEKLICGDYDPGPQAPSRFYIPPQHAAALASQDPAIAYLLGLFRVVRPDAEGTRKRVYKVQGSWPEGRRFCVYTQYDPNFRLARPRMGSVSASQSDSTRVLRDYATCRTHHHIRIADLSWKQGAAGTSGQSIWFGPSAFLVLREHQGYEAVTCKAAFYVPQDHETDRSTGRTHYCDWYDFYPDTDINKVLDGDYSYQIACHDLFGQVSDFRSANVTVDPRDLRPGEIQRPEIALSSLPDPSDPSTQRNLEIPLEVVESDQGFVLKGFNRDHIELDYSFFWPLESSYVWDRNRATGKASVDHFKLLHLAGTPMFANVKLTIEVNDSSGVTVKLTGVGKAVGTSVPQNNQLYSLLERLEAVDSAGSIVVARARAALVGGSLVFRQEWEVVDVTVTPAADEITLRLLPASDPERQKLEDAGCYYPNVYLRGSHVHGAKLFWNVDATHGGSRIGWKVLGDPNHEIRPAPRVSFAGKLVREVAMPQGVVQTPADLVPSLGLVSIKLPDPSTTAGPAGAVDNHFIIRLPKSHTLAHFRRIQIVPIAGDTSLEPGEYAKPQPADPGGIDYPESVSTLFSEDRIVSFYAARVGDDTGHPGKAIFRGEPLPFTSNDPVQQGEYLVYPDKNHQSWLVIVPTVVRGREVPLKCFLDGRNFNQDQYLSSTVSLALLAVVSGYDDEVEDSLQKTIATKKMAFVKYLPPPTITVPAQPQPSFGVAAGAPDYNGDSLIRMKRIYEGYDLANRLSGSLLYVIYRLPSERATGSDVEVKYAKDVSSGGIYRRNMVDIKTALDALSSTDPLAVASLQSAFADYAARVNDTPLTREKLLDYAVTLPGDSRAVSLYALKAFDTTAAKESEDFVALSPPIYVEDASTPAAPQIRIADFVIRQQPPPSGPGVFLEIEIKLARSLVSPAFGYASESELNANLLGPEFRHIIKQYRLYLTTGREGLATSGVFDEDLLASPDDSDFVKITGPAATIGDPALFPSFDETILSIMIPPNSITTSMVANDPDSIVVNAQVEFDSGVETSEIPTRVFTCVRAENYLGQLSPLTLTPGVLRGMI